MTMPIRKDLRRSCLTYALEESVKLQSHYAMLLNMYDGGQRMQFDNGAAWVARLRELGKIPAGPSSPTRTPDDPTPNP